jgi:hypothetical protein
MSEPKGWRADVANSAAGLTLRATRKFVPSYFFPSRYNNTARRCV